MKIFIIVGTRPEYIKLAPVYLEFQSLNKLAENGTVAKRTSSRLRRTNDRSVLRVHEDHEDDENAEIGVRQQCQNEGEGNAGNGVVQRSPKIIPEIKWIHTNQHNKLILSDLLEFWEIRPDYEFSLVNQGLSLSELAAKLLTEADLLFRKEKPDLVIVQGDTLSAVQAALAAFYNHIRVAHVEAGLRTVNPKSPFPEELSRRVISQIADYHFCPSEKVYQRLVQEKRNGDHEASENAEIGVSLHLDGRVAKRTSSRLRRTNDRSVLRVHEDHEDDENAGIGVSLHAHNIFNTGNTGIDALFKAQSIINNRNLKLGNSTILEKNSRKEFRLDVRKYILITSHRRENINNGFQEALCKSIFEILQEKNKRNSENELISNAEETVEFIVCLHTNPQARENFLKLSAKLLSMNISGINLLESVTYSGFIQLMQNALFIITDSGGVQEEAAYLSKYTLVMREEAEREEYLEQGVSERLSPDSKSIKLAIESLISRLMNNSQAEVRPQLHSFYGNGDAAKKIVKLIWT
ncbi:MAG: UDP-N-acetyl glucosamine 2-epimerase [Proteobacteria bacterium]|nr:UDP-N-acetyl glucosamine 2-epimerase [Pseudomonadota bacterium]